jgi:hypothetical protein
MSLNTEDKLYIGKEIRFIVNDEFSRHLGALNEEFQSRYDLLMEIVRDRPTKSEILDIIHTETPPIIRKEIHYVLDDVLMPTILDIKKIVINNEKRIGKLESASYPF